MIFFTIQLYHVTLWLFFSLTPTTISLVSKVFYHKQSFFLIKRFCYSISKSLTCCNITSPSLRDLKLNWLGGIKNKIQMPKVPNFLLLSFQYLDTYMFTLTYTLNQPKEKRMEPKKIASWQWGQKGWIFPYISIL